MARTYEYNIRFKKVSESQLKRRERERELKTVENISQDLVKRLLSYDMDTGIFTWNCYRSKYAKKGGVAGTLTKQGYICISINGKHYMAHRLVFLYVNGAFPEIYVDHINGIRTDNKWNNLRHATHAENSQNIRLPKSNNKSGLLGAYWSKKNSKWFSTIKANGKTVGLGYFDTKEDAHNSYLQAKRKAHDFNTL